MRVFKGADLLLAALLPRAGIGTGLDLLLRRTGGEHLGHRLDQTLGLDRRRDVDDAIVERHAPAAVAGDVDRGEGQDVLLSGVGHRGAPRAGVLAREKRTDDGFLTLARVGVENGPVGLHLGHVRVVAEVAAVRLAFLRFAGWNRRQPRADVDARFADPRRNRGGDAVVRAVGVGEPPIEGATAFRRAATLPAHGICERAASLRGLRPARAVHELRGGGGQVIFSTASILRPIHRRTGTAMLLPMAVYRGPSAAMRHVCPSTTR